MPDSAAQQFLRNLDKKLWGAAGRLRTGPDAAVYKDAVLGLIFLKYPPEGQEEAVTLALQQAEALPDTWSSNS